MVSHKNRGMLLESVINKTIQSYYEKKSALIHKKNLDIKFKSVDALNKAKNAYISKKSTVDYYGVYQGMFLAFEAKSSETNLIPKASFKQHQQKYLLDVIEHKGKAFYILFFKKASKIFIISAIKINFLKSNSISLEYVADNGFELDIIYPGWIDFLEYINYL